MVLAVRFTHCLVLSGADADRCNYDGAGYDAAGLLGLIHMPSLSRTDIDFLLFDWLRVQSLTGFHQFSEHSTETFEAALDTYQSIAAEEFAPHFKLGDQCEPTFDGESVQLIPEVAAALQAFIDSGLMAAVHGPEHGGMSLPYVLERAGFAFVAAANGGTAAYAFLTMANANLLLHYGSPSQQRRFAGPLLAGRFFGTMCLSEPGAGSSLAHITTRAVRQTDGRYRIRGNKMWISGGDHDLAENIVHLVLAKIPDEEGRLPPGTDAISLFAVPKFLVAEDGSVGERNDVVLAGLNHKMGNRGTTNCLLNFGEGRYLPEGAQGALGELVGEQGRGLACMFHMMNEARIGVGLCAAATGYAGYLHALDYARTRRQGRGLAARESGVAPVPIIEHADVRRMLLAQKAYVEGGLALVLYAARLIDEQRTTTSDDTRRRAALLLDLLTPVVKSWPSQWCLAANDLAIQVHGGYGYAREYEVEQLYRDNRLNAIHEGTHGIQALDLLGRKVGAESGAGLRTLADRMRMTIDAASRIPEVARYGAALDAAWDRIVRTTESLMSLSDVESRLANAAPYMEAFGHVVVAWIWLDQAMASMRSSRLSAEAKQGKLQACRFFFCWELPRIDAWLAVLDPLDLTAVQMQGDWY